MHAIFRPPDKQASIVIPPLRVLLKSRCLYPVIAIHASTPEWLHLSHRWQRRDILPGMLVKHVTIRQKEFVGSPVRVTDDIVHRIGTTVSIDAVARMHVSRMMYDIRLFWYGNLQGRGKRGRYLPSSWLSRSLLRQLWSGWGMSIFRFRLRDCGRGNRELHSQFGNECYVRTLIYNRGGEEREVGLVDLVCYGGSLRFTPLDLD